MNYKKYNDYELIYMVRENDDDSHDILFKKYYPIIKRIAYEYYSKYSEYGFDYDDFVQEGIISFQRAIDNFDEKKDIMFYTFVLVCIRRGLMTFTRSASSTKNKIFSEHEEVDEGIMDIDSDVSNIYDKLLFEDIFKKAIYDMESDFSTVLELKINGFTYKEIGSLLSVPVSSVEFRCRKIRAYLSKELKNYNK